MGDISGYAENSPHDDPSTVEPVLFYEADSASAAETKRQEHMAILLANSISLRAIGEEAIHREGVVVVDIGSGANPLLGESLVKQNPTLCYVAVDIEEDAVASQQQAGFEAYQSLATELPLKLAAADVVHARFAFGWLDREARRRALGEMLRIGRDSSELVIIDYDWSVIEGPEPFRRLTARTREILESFRFDPACGTKLPAEIQTVLSGYGFGSQDFVLSSRPDLFVQTLDQALGTIRINIVSMQGKLWEAGLGSLADELEVLYQELATYAVQNPTVGIRFPDTITTKVQLVNTAKHRQIAQQLEQRRSLEELKLHRETLLPVGPTELGAYILQEPFDILCARRLHAIEYHNSDNVTQEGIAIDGTLKPSIDSPKTVDVSLWLAICDEHSKMAGCIRLIKPEDGNPLLLPTVAKLSELFGDNPTVQAFIEDLLGSGLHYYEASALAKSSLSHDRLATTKLLAAEVLIARQLGYDRAIVGLEEKTDKLLLGMFGAEVFQRIGGPDVIITLTGEGLRPGGVRLVPYCVDMHHFFDNCIKHIESELRGSAVEPPRLKLLKAIQNYQLGPSHESVQVL